MLINVKRLTAAPKLIVGLFALVLSVFPAPSASAEKWEPVAKVNGTVLTEFDLEEAVNKLVPSRIFHGGISYEQRVKYRPEALEMIIDDELLHQEALRLGIEVDKQRIKDSIKDLSNRFGGKKRLKAVLKGKGLSIRDYKKILKKTFLLEKVIEQEINRKADVSEDEVREYYNENKERYLRPPAWKVSQILVSVAPGAPDEERANMRKRAEYVREKALAGEEFATLAWDYSDDSYRYVGGDLGFVHKGRLDPKFEDVLSTMEPGGISNVIESIYGFHLLKLNEVKEPQQLSFEEVSQRIISAMTEERKKKLKEALISRLRDEAEIEIY